MNRLVYPALVIVSSVLVSQGVARAYGGGDGSPESPYEIHTAAEMNSIGANPGDWDKHFVLMADIDLSAYTGNQFNIIGTDCSNAFTGTFDGNGHTISNFTYESTDERYVGIFGCLSGADAEIRNLGLTDPNINAATTERGGVGSLVGFVSLGAVSSSYAEGSGCTVSGSGPISGYLGGLVGETDDGRISGSHFSGQVSTYGMEATGGLLGFGSRGSVANSHSTGSVAASAPGFYLATNVGGLVGKFQSYSGDPATISNCYSDSSVSGSMMVGGLVGQSYINCSIEDSHATGDVYGEEKYVGGLVGAASGRIVNSYATGSVSGDANVDGVGGLVGGLGDGIVKNSYATGMVAGDAMVGGLAGLLGDGTYDGGSFITESHASGDVTGNDDVGGLVGRSATDYGFIADCYATGDVSGALDYAGGLVGRNQEGGIEDSYSLSGSVSGGSSVGGLLGFNNGTVSGCYAATGVVSGTANVGGLVGENDDSKGKCAASFWDTETSGQTSSDCGTGKTTAEMRDPQTFLDAGWDFAGESGNGPSEIWAAPELPPDYMRLWWQLPSPPPSSSFQGSGTPGDPYLVHTVIELNSIGHHPGLMGADFKLVNDIDLAATEFFMIGSKGHPFTGVFDGNNKAVSNFTHASTDRDYVGLFGYAGFCSYSNFYTCDGFDTEIKNLELLNPGVNAGTGDFVGSLAGYFFDGTIRGCSVVGGSVSGAEHVGGMLGFDRRATVEGAHATVQVSGERYVGGLSGSNYQATIEDSHSSGATSGVSRLGGLVGSNDDYGKILRSYSASTVSGTEAVGGLVGQNGMWGNIEDSYSRGPVSGTRLVGGLVGYDWSKNWYDTSIHWITRSYATGLASGAEYVGGLVGSSDHSCSSGSFFDVDTGGPDNGCGTAATTPEMKDPNTFLAEGWDLTTTWDVLAGLQYPRLRWQETCNDDVDNDGDGLSDLDDPGCADAVDMSEKDDTGTYPCDDGVNNGDADGRIDFDPATFANPGDQYTLPAGYGDPGCKDPYWPTESPQCQDGVNNDLGQDPNPGHIDYDAGYSANGFADPNGPDPQCVGEPWKNRESKPYYGCGLGVELALFLPSLMWLWRRRRGA